MLAMLHWAAVCRSGGEGPTKKEWKWCKGPVSVFAAPSEFRL